MRQNDHIWDREVRSAQDAYNAMEELVPQMDAVIHCMAVSDFTFKRDDAVKCSSSDPEAFIEYMRKTITKNPKIIGKIKQWNPKTVLIGFKFEVGLGLGELIILADKSITGNGCDLVVANDKAEMTREQEHVAHFVYSEAMQQAVGAGDFEVRGKDEIAKEIAKFLSEVL
jgi:phosphopantothenate-cysteine ligase